LPEVSGTPKDGFFMNKEQMMLGQVRAYLILAENLKSRYYFLKAVSTFKQMELMMKKRDEDKTVLMAA
jgi:hypothetical protein